MWWRSPTSDLKLTPSLLAMLERIERHSGALLMLAVTASGGQDGKLNKLRGAGYVVKCDHPSVTEYGWPAEALLQDYIHGMRGDDRAECCQMLTFRRRDRTPPNRG